MIEEVLTRDTRTPLALLTSASYLQPENWTSKLAQKRSSISHLMLRVGQKELSQDISEETSINHPSPLLENLKRKQKKLLHTVANLFILRQGAPESGSVTQEVKHLKWLQEKGYVELAEKLKDHSGFPWDEIKKICSPILMEQLVDLHQLYQKTSAKDFCSEEDLMGFALNLASMTTDRRLSENYVHTQELIEDAKEILGQLIYLADKHPSRLGRCFVNSQYTIILTHIEQEFDKAIEDIFNHLQNHFIAHYETQIQSPELAQQMLIPKEIGTALITQLGTVNFGIIDILSHVFLSDETLLNHQISLSHALKLFQNSPKLRAKFEKIKPPLPDAPSAEVIRATLGLPPKTPLTAWHTELTLFIALSSHLRQRGSQSCFATSLALKMLSAHLTYCFKDLSQLVQKSKLTRQVNGVCKDIPFIKRIADENLLKEITLDNKGSLVINGVTHAGLWEAPGIQAAAHAIDLQNLKSVILAIIPQLNFDQNNQCKLTVETILKKMCEYTTKQHPENRKILGTLFSQACFAFSSQETQPLLRVWENAIANMAEAQEGSLIKSHILQSVLYALQYKLHEADIPPSPIIQKFFLNFQKGLFETLHLQYDPAIGIVSNNKEPKTAGFVLYKKDERIDQASLFQDFIKSLILKAEKKSRPTQQADKLHYITDLLYKWVETNEFLNLLLLKYHPSNQLIETLADNYDKLEFTPWTTREGNRTRDVLEVYLEKNEPIKSEHFISEGQEERLRDLINLCKQMSQEEKQTYLDNPNKIVQFRIRGVHAGGVFFGHPSLSKAWQDDCQTEDWIEKAVLAPGRHIAQTTMDDTIRTEFVKTIKESILPAFLSKEKWTTFLEFLAKIPETSIKEYRRIFLEIYQQIDPASIPMLDKLARQVDAALCQSLTEDLKKQLQESAVHFGDTNMPEGTKDLHFCFVINPGTGDLELWEVNDDGSHFVPLIQSYWLKEWEIFPLSEEMMPSDPVKSTEEELPFI